MAGPDLNELKRRMDGAVTSFKGDLAGLRTGRASANLLDPIVVSAYGSQMPLNTRNAIRAWITNGALNDCP